MQTHTTHLKVSFRGGLVMQSVALSQCSFCCVFAISPRVLPSTMLRMHMFVCVCALCCCESVMMPRCKFEYMRFGMLACVRKRRLHLYSTRGILGVLYILYLLYNYSEYYMYTTTCKRSSFSSIPINAFELVIV